jgi:hypothetical protein
MLDIQTSLAPIHIASSESVNRAAVQAVWSASQDRDEPAGRPRDGWWSIPDWATTSRILMHEDKVIGFAAIEYQPGAGAAETRLGLLLALVTWRWFDRPQSAHHVDHHAPHGALGQH